MKRVVYLDMDGVLTDYCQQTENFYNKSVRHLMGRTDLNHEETKELKEVFDKCDFDKKFWLTMPKMPFADNLYKLCKEKFDDVYILSAFVAPKDFPQQFQMVQKAKKEWIKQNIDSNIPDDHIIITDQKKSSFIKPDEKSYLIDDYPKNLNYWHQDGGIDLIYLDYISFLEKNIVPRPTVKGYETLKNLYGNQR